MTQFSKGAPEGVLIIEDFLDVDTMTTLRSYADCQIGVINKVEVAQEDGRLKVQRHEGFTSDRIYVKGIDKIARKICDDVFGKVIPQNYGAEMEWYEYPHIIRYRKGGNYKPHSDADSWDPDKIDWIRSVDRDYSAIIYFNDAFEGGGLYFPGHDYRIQPKPGLLVCFPSGGRYEHTAEKVISGNRYAFVTWAAAVGTHRVFEKPRSDIVYMRGR